MSKPVLCIKVVDTWANYSAKDNHLVRILQKHYDVKFVRQNPSLLIFSCFGYEHTQYTSFDCVKLFFTGENTAPDFTQCDYAMGFDDMDFGDRYQKMPLFAHHPKMDAIITRPSVTQADVDTRTRFCNFIYSNRRAAPLRQEIYKKLNAYKTVESAGKYLRNVMVDEQSNITSGRGKPNTFDKLKVQEQYRFSIAFENSEYGGYTTEKIMDAFAARTIPIYWGNPDVLQMFNPAAFINAYDFDSIDAVVDEVIRIDNDPAAYLEMINAPVFKDAYLALPPISGQVEAFLLKIVSQPPAVARKRPKSGASRALELRAAKKYSPLLTKLKRPFSAKPTQEENVPGFSLLRKK